MKKTTKTQAERQADARARKLLRGLQEVRGVFVAPQLHSKVKAHAQRLQADLDRRAP